MTLVATAKQSRVSRCRVRAFSVALDLAAVRGIERADRITPLAGEWPQVGSLPTRSGDVPVFSLAGLLELSEVAAQDGSQVLVTDTPSGPVGLLVDQSAQGSVLGGDDLVRMPGVVQSPHFPAVVRTGAGLLPWLDPLSLFTGQSSRESPLVAPWRHRVSGTAQSRLMVIPLPGAAPAERAWALGLPAAAVAELVEPQQVVPVPGAPDFVAGVMSWRDRVTGVVDLCAWLGLQQRDVGQPLVAVVATPGGTEPVGLLIPRGVRMVKLPIPNLASERAFPGAAERVVASVEIFDQTIALIDLASLAHGHLIAR